MSDKEAYEIIYEDISKRNAFLKKWIYVLKYIKIYF